VVKPHQRGLRCRVVMWRQLGLCRGQCSMLSCLSDKLRDAVKGVRSTSLPNSSDTLGHGCPLTLALALPFHSFLSYPPRSPSRFRERQLSGLQSSYSCHKGSHISSVPTFPFTDRPSHVRNTSLSPRPRARLCRLNCYRK
jgi:hypothetical protein